jgi:hypothetical protein
MKKLLIPLLLTCIIIQNCSDKNSMESEPVSIKSYIEANTSQPEAETLQYLRKRCAATFLIVADLIPRQSLKNEKTIDQFISAANVFLMMPNSISEIDSSVNPAKFRLRDTEEVKKIFGELKNKVDRDFAKTGILFGSLQADLEFCETAANARFK